MPERASVRVKICGLTRRADAELAVDAGATAIGLVFWPGSPRAVTIDAAARIAAAVPESVERVGVFVNATAPDIQRVLDGVPLSAVQLHGDERPQSVGGIPRPVIKAVSLASGTAEDVASAWPREVALLVDVDDPVRRGGTGRLASWERAAALARLRPIILSGGLRAENVAEAIATVRPWGVDVSSGVESAPGLKDAARLRAFFAAVAAAGMGEVS
jgi:phosphoribosylanthranilate isomerase